MDPLLVVFKHSCLHMNIYGMEDIAVLKCVSKDIRNELDDIYKDEDRKTKLLETTCQTMGYVSKTSLQHDTVLNRDLYVKYMVQLTRYYNPNVTTCNKLHADFVSFLEDFTKTNAIKVFTKCKNISLQEQVNTINELLCFTYDNKNIATKILAIYLMYYFISKLYKKNIKTFVKDKKQCILGSVRFRKTCISKGNEIVLQCKDEITLFPYRFIDKLIRLLQETTRNLVNVNH
jgi:hypothetical protein